MRTALHIFLMVVFLLPAAAEELEDRYRSIQQRITEQERKLKQAKEIEGSFLLQIEMVNRKLDETRASLREQRAKILNMRERIRLVKNDMAVVQEMLERQRKYLKRKLSSMQRYGNEVSNLFNAVVSSESFPQMLRTVRYLRKVAEYDYRQISMYRENLQKLEKKKEELGTLYAQLKDEERELKRSEDELSADKKHKEILLASIRKQKDGYRDMLDELTAASNRLKEMLEKKDANTYQLTKFALLKGRLPWPVDGPVAIPYGSYRDPQFNTPVFRRGIYIKAGEGMVAKAVYAGKVVYADWFKGYGKVIIIDHGSGYHSVYANLSELFVRQGDRLGKWHGLGRVGESGTINAPALYFEMRYKGKPLNPLQWLAAKK